jgi:propane monooxygenase small subunit
VWQPVREVVELLTGVRDWAEAVVATNLAFEPLVGELFRSRFVMSTAAANGDFVTPLLMNVAESDFDRDLSYTTILLGDLVADKEYGQDNVGVLSGWLEDWIPRSLQAARALEPIFGLAEHGGIPFADALAHARARTQLILDDLKIPRPKELEA